MREDLKHIEKIEAYLRGDLSKEETTDFRNQINQNRELRKEVELFELMEKAIVRKAIKNDVAKYGGGKSFLFLKGLGIILGVLLIAGLIYYFNPTKSTTVQYVKELNTDLEIEKSTNEVVDILQVEKNRGDEKVSNYPEESTKSKNNSGDKPYGGLKTWVEPNLQVFEIDPQKGATIEGEEGTLLIIPENAFEDQNGKIVSEPFKIELIEALRVSDMIAYNLTTMSGKNPLSSGGMVFLEPVNKGGDSIRVRSDRPIYMEIPSEDYNPNMMSWDGVVGKEGNMDWQNPKALEKYLVPVDFTLLDFIPEGFDEAVAAGLPFQGHKELTKELIDTLYYSLTLLNASNNLESNTMVDSDISEEQGLIPPINSDSRKRKWFSGLFERIGFSGNRRSRQNRTEDSPVTFKGPNNDKVEEDKSKISNEICHIDPMSVKTIQQPKFSNTFLATKEFEQRLKVLHTIPYGQKYFDIYLNNLTEDLWRADLKVARNLEGEHKTIFEKFASQRLTNVKEAPIHMDKLKNYYSAKREEFKRQQLQANKKYKSKQRKELNELSQKIENTIKEYKKVGRVKTAKQEKSLRIPNVATSRNSYAASWYGFGWKNIDAYLKLIEEDSKEVDILSNISGARVYQCINTLKTIIPLNLIAGRRIAKFPNRRRTESQEMEDTYAIGIFRNGVGELYYSEKHYNPYNLEEITLAFYEINRIELYGKLRRLDGDNNPLIKKLKEEQKQIEKQQRIIAKKEELLEKIERQQAALKELQAAQQAERDYILSLWRVLDHCPEEIRSKKTMVKKM